VVPERDLDLAWFLMALGGGLTALGGAVVIPHMTPVSGRRLTRAESAGMTATVGVALLLVAGLLGARRTRVPDVASPYLVFSVLMISLTFVACAGMWALAYLREHVRRRDARERFTAPEPIRGLPRVVALVLMSGGLVLVATGLIFARWGPRHARRTATGEEPVSVVSVVVGYGLLSLLAVGLAGIAVRAVRRKAAARRRRRPPPMEPPPVW
jgi:hypothetical protein